jgi:hypothetical protein
MCLCSECTSVPRPQDTHGVPWTADKTTIVFIHFFTCDQEELEVDL